MKPSSSPYRLDHIALHVESLSQAEKFYARLFGLRVLGRMEPTECGYHGASCVLGKGEFRLVLEADADEPSANGRLAHVFLHVGAEDLEAIRREAAALCCRIVCAGTAELVLLDVYSVRWHLLVSDDRY